VYVKHVLRRGLTAGLNRTGAFCVTAAALATNIGADVGVLSATGEFRSCFGGRPEDLTLWGMIQNNEPVIPTLILIGMAAYSLELIAERWFTIVIARRQSLSYLLRVGAALFHKRFEEAAALSVEYPRSPVAFAVLAFVRSNSNDRSDPGNPCMQEWRRALVIKSTELKRRIWTLGAIGWSAPLVGALFASLRITQTFQSWYAAGGTSFALAADEIANAAWGISFSIVIAVPAIWSYRYLSAQTETLLLEMESLSLSVIEQLTDQRSGVISHASSDIYITQELSKSSTRRIAR
jgi:biopolymer transport protein ExbB/TolQ